MTEEIIIDGVNVKGCKYFKTNYKEDCDVKIDNCCCETYVPCWQEYKKDCYYKQLKRAEIEIEKLKGADGSAHPDSAYYKITRLEQERDDLQLRKDKYYQQTLDDAITISDLITKCNDLEQENKANLKQIELDVEHICRLNEQIGKLEQENERLKDNNNHLQVIIDDGRAENKRFREENKELKECYDGAKILNDAYIELTGKYKQALEEIKKYIVDELCGYYHSKKDDYNEILEKIESIIDEVLNEN